MAFVAFWIALAAVIIMGAWNSRRSAELRHGTLRLMLEKGEKVDETVLLGLLKPADPYASNAKPGDAYKALRIIGTMVLFLAPGLALLLNVIGFINGTREVQVIGLAIGGLLALLGAGLHVCTRFVDRPPAR